MDVVSIATAWGLKEFGKSILLFLSSPGGQLALLTLLKNRGIDEKVLAETYASVRDRDIPPPKPPDANRGPE